MKSEKEAKKEEQTSSLMSKCACGKIKIRVELPSNPEEEDFSAAVDCHCPACRKYHVAAFASYLNVPADQVETSDCREEDLQTFTETCHEVGSVERLFCRHCYTKVASRPISPVVVGEETSSPSKMLINMGGLVCSSIPKPYKNAWSKGRTAWQEPSRASWTRARPPKQYTGTGMPPLASTTGGCACGKCRYQVRHVPYEMQHCYCHLCRQLSGAAFQTWVPAANEDFVWTTSPPPELKRTTPHGQRHICTTCGSVLTIVYDEQPDTTWPAAGGLDDGQLPQTQEEMDQYLDRVCHICCKWKQKWYDLPKDGLERIKYAC